MDDGSNPKYYGFISHTGEWYILKEDSVAKTYRYIRGQSGYTGNWTGRAALTYSRYNECFG